MTNPAPITRLGAQRAAQHELSKAIYHRTSDPFVVRAVRAAGRAIDHVLNSALNHAPAGDAGALSIVVVVAIAVALVIWRVGVPQRSAKVGALLTAGTTMSAAEHRSLAELAAAAGDWKTAVVERMRAVARELEERSVVDARAGRTASELARDAGRAMPSVAPALSAAAELFNAIVYGDAAATAADVTAVVEADDAVRRSDRSKVLAR